MNEPKFTPLPNSMVADCVKEANARLIAAAPDLLEALQSIAREPREQSLEYGAKSLRDKARAAIAKATGEE